ncbi:TVP38/TMEM64 family protein [Rubrobacter indicoceani]|uniref:TVP38/TMEM64 family protein n=1 Tax=Rubrobacter indicoceani TaxID=2051957 RepID=UPI0013C4CFB3|nr:TVP38/TMEM64 family protein [Rubrobacter indicoceani]
MVATTTRPGGAKRPANRSVRAVALAAPALLIVLAALVPGVREAVGEIASAAFRGDGAGVRDGIQLFGALAPVVSFGLALVHIVVPFPAEVLALANGLAFGFWGGLAVTWSSFMVAALLTYALGRTLGRPLLERFVPTRHRARLDLWLTREGFFPLLALRLIPLVPFNALCLACGVVKVKLWTYTWVTAIGILPIDIALSLIGSRLGETEAREADLGAGFWAVTVLLVAFVLVGWVVSRRLKSGDRGKVV